jgi:hypothetical protein
MALRRVLTIVAVAGVVAALLAGAYWALNASSPQPNEDRLVAAVAEPPQLYCMIIRFTGEPRLEFLFDIERAGSELQFEQLYLIEIVGSDKTKLPPLPEWRFDAGAEPARLESEIRVFDNSAAGSHTEKITIELYDYHPEKADKGWIEAGMKSIHYQNLSGQCQQSGPVPPASTGN